LHKYSASPILAIFKFLNLRMFSMAGKISILYVDDEQNNLVSFKAVFRIKYHVLTAISAEEAIDILKKNEVHIIITDQRMPHMTGVEFLESILGDFPDPIRILLTGYADMNAVIDAINKGKIFHYLSKPWNEEELDITIARAYDVYKQRMDEKEMNQKLSISNEQLEFLLRQKLLS
jgi:response regulator RpfG family c-di-GMP phosphodiesterase